jgi:hypothetical protein
LRTSYITLGDAYVFLMLILVNFTLRYQRAEGGCPMDAVFVFVALAFFAATWGLMRVIQKP